MGGNGSKAAAAASRAKDVADVLRNTASAASTTAKRKIVKEGQQFMAPERAQKVLEKQQHVPKRAPMNLGSAKVPDDVRSHRMKEIKEQQKEDKSYLSLMKDVYVSSEDPETFIPKPLDEHSDKRSENLESRLPQRKEHLLPSSYQINEEVPRGRATIRTIIDALYNNKTNPQDWGPAEVAQKINIRESDAKDVLDNFELLEGTSIFKSEIGENKK